MQTQGLKSVKSVLISLFHKEPALELIQKLGELGITIYSTGGTLDFIRAKGLNAISVEELTSFPPVFGGRVKTLHPNIFGAILYRRDDPDDLKELAQYAIPSLDMVIVDLYPFEETITATKSHDEIIEKIDIGGISLIRAAAKNYAHTWVVPSSEYFQSALQILKEQGASTTLDQRKEFASAAFHISSHYDTAIHSWLDPLSGNTFKKSFKIANKLRYGENPHQVGTFFGNYKELFQQLGGKELSYNNILDIEGAVNLILEFDVPTFVIIKHTNACGVASRENILEAYQAALASDPISAFGGILISNRNIDPKSAYAINELFFEVILAPGYDEEALNILGQKKNRIILKINQLSVQKLQYRSALNGVLVQSENNARFSSDNWTVVTNNGVTDQQGEDLIFANKIVKHIKSNAIVLAKGKQLLGSGTGQTSRIDALKQAITKAKEFGHITEGAVMASDAFFPFADCVELANEAGITSVIQPGGSVRDKDSIDFCNKHNMSMVTTGIRLFKH